MSDTTGSGEVIRFGAFEVDTRTGELRKHGRRVNLQEQPFRVLCLLLERPAELVTRDELRQKLWGADHFVDFEHGLNKAVNKLREALGDDRETPLYVETLPRRGYRFIAPIARVRAPAPGAGETGGPAPIEPGVGFVAPRRRRTSVVGTATLAGLLVLAAGFWYLTAHGRRDLAVQPGSVGAIRSLAVLPLQSLSADPGQEFFAEGMTDELITDLGQMSALRVISRTSVMHYKQTTKTLAEIGRELGADAIVEGTVFSAGNRVRITAQLVDARSDRHLWAREYERDLRDVLDLQEEVARDIADEINVELTPQERARLTGAHPVDPRAHEAYLQGHYFWHQFTEPDVARSLEFFERATELDRTDALAYSGLADYYGVMYVRFDALPWSEACPKGEAAALKAVALDDDLAEAHNSLGALRMFCDWDWQSAEAEVRRALQLNPNYVEARRVYAVWLVATGHADSGVAEMRRAVENDPMSPDLHLVFAWACFMARHYDQAIGQYQVALGMDPGRAATYGGLGDVYVQMGRLELAVREYRKAVELSGQGAEALANLGYAEALAGRRRDALDILARLNEQSVHRPVSAAYRALIYAALGDRRQAFAWLEEAYRQHETGMIWLRTAPEFNSLRHDPRFQDLERRVGL